MSARIKPTRVRGRELEEVREADPDGRPVLHYRIIDPLARMRRAGTITDAMYNAARDFQAAFVIAQLEPLRALSMLRVPGAGAAPELHEHQLDARRRVHEALQALGGLSSPAGAVPGTWSAASAAFGIGRCASAGVAGRCRRVMRRASWSRRSASWLPGPIHGAAVASRVDAVQREM